MLSFRSLAFCFSIGCHFCLTLYLFFELLLLSYRSLALCFGVGRRLGLALYLFFKSLLLSYRNLEFCFNISCFCLTLFLLFDGG